MIINVRADIRRTVSPGGAWDPCLLLWYTIDDGKFARERIWRSTFPMDWFRWQEVVTKSAER